MKVSAFLLVLIAGSSTTLLSGGRAFAYGDTSLKDVELSSDREPQQAAPVEKKNRKSHRERTMSLMLNTFGYSVMPNRQFMTFYTPGATILYELRPAKFFSLGFSGSSFVFADTRHEHPAHVSMHSRAGLLLRFVIPATKNLQFSIGHLIGWNGTVFFQESAAGTGYASQTVIGARYFWNSWEVALDAGASTDFIWGLKGEPEWLISLGQISLGAVRRF